MTSTRRANLAGIVGRAAYRRGKGAVWLEPVRAWILPALGGGAALKYLGLPADVALLLMVGVAIVWEGAAIGLGWLEHRMGATAEHYKAAASTDFFKSESLRLSGDILKELRALRDASDRVSQTGSVHRAGAE